MPVDIKVWTCATKITYLVSAASSSLLYLFFYHFISSFPFPFLINSRIYLAFCPARFQQSYSGTNRFAMTVGFLRKMLFGLSYRFMTGQVFSMIYSTMSFSSAAEDLKGYPVENWILVNTVLILFIYHYHIYLNLPGTHLFKRQVFK